MKEGLVSVIVPTRDRAHLLAETLASAQLQSHSNLEVLVVDDASTDGTEELVTRIAATDGRVQYRRLDKPSGAPVARNLALSDCRGEFVQFLDSDDVVHPEKFRVQVELLNSSPGHDLAVCQTGMFVKKPGDNQILWNRILGDPLLRFVQHDMPWVTVGPLWRKSLIDRVGGHDESLPSSQDYEHASRAMILGARPLLHRHMLSFYRVHDSGSIGRASAPYREEVHHKVFKSIRDLLFAERKMTPQFKEELAQDFLWVAGRAANFGKGPLAEEAFACGMELSQVPGREETAGRILGQLRASGFDGPEFTDETYRELDVDLDPRVRWWGRYAFYTEPSEPIPAQRRYRRA